MEREQKQQFIVWQNENPVLACRIRIATGKLAEIQERLLGDLCDEIDDLNLDGYSLKEFVEDAGRRLGNFNQLYQFFIQLGGEYK